MAAQTSGSTPTDTNTTPAGRGLKWWLIRIAIVLVLGLAGALGWRQIREFREHRMVDRARALIAQKDYAQAMLSARRALHLNPRDAAVVRMMVELSESAKNKEALHWRRVLVELEPGNAANILAWADCALRFEDATVAEQALAHVDEAGKKTAAFHGVAGRLAQMLNKIPEAEAHFSEAVKMEPENPQYEVLLAAVRIYSDKPEQRAEAQAILEGHVADPKVRGVASHGLLDEFLRRNEWEKALALAKLGQESPDATFGDRMLYLGLLRRFQRPEFHGYLLTLQEIAAANPDDTATLISWLADNTLVMVAVSWAKTLPPKVASTTPVPAALGECYAALHDWPALKKLVTDANWEYVEFLRLAFLARVQRENGDLLNSRNSWSNAVAATGNRPDEILMLTRHATKWGWNNEVTDLLWGVARGNTGQRVALDALYQNYAATGNTRGLLNVSARMLEINPKDPVAANNVVLLSLLLNSTVERAHALADEAYKLDPKNPGIISTYAFALHLRGETDKGIELMRSLGEKQLADPGVAAYFASMLVESPKPDEAAQYIGIAQTGKLLPEEMALVKAAREKLIRRSADKEPTP